jgi:mRNA interferase RelE/StbE
MAYAPIYSGRAKDDLAKLDKADARRVVEKIAEYCRASNPLRFASPLKGVLSGLYRFRVGDYRAIFRVERGGRIALLFILRIGHRREIYDL